MYIVLYTIECRVQRAFLKAADVAAFATPMRCAMGMCFACSVYSLDAHKPTEARLARP